MGRLIPGSPTPTSTPCSSTAPRRRRDDQPCQGGVPMFIEFRKAAAATSAVALLATGAAMAPAVAQAKTVKFTMKETGKAKGPKFTVNGTVRGKLGSGKCHSTTVPPQTKGSWK